MQLTFEKHAELGGNLSGRMHSIGKRVGDLVHAGDVSHITFCAVGKVAERLAGALSDDGGFAHGESVPSSSDIACRARGLPVIGKLALRPIHRVHDHVVAFANEGQ